MKTRSEFANTFIESRLASSREKREAGLPRTTTAKCQPSLSGTHDVPGELIRYPVVTVTRGCQCSFKFFAASYPTGPTKFEPSLASSMASSSTPTFISNERVLCYHGPLMYEAKVLKAETWDESNTKLGTVGPHYFVHYKGWKQTCVPSFSFSFSFLLRVF